MALQTWVARFVVDHGRVTEEGGLLRSFPRRRLDEQEVDLHLLASPTGAKGEELGAQALDAIGRLFLQDRLSLTGGLRRAITNTHQTLLDWNRRSVVRDQVSVGVVGAVVSGTTVYLAQTGPGLVYLKRDGQLERLLPTPAAAGSLGEGEVEPDLRRLDLSAGDLILAASPQLTSVLDEGTMTALLSRSSEEALPELYLMTRDLESFCLLTISWIDRPEDEPPPPLLEADVSTEAEDEDESSSPATSGPFASAEATGTETASVLTAPEPLDISRSIVRLRNDQAIARTPYTRTTGARSRFSFQMAERRLLVMFATAAIVLLIGALTVPGLIRENRSQRLGTLLTSSQTSLSAALAATDPGERRRLLEETRRLAAEALRLDRLSSVASELHTQAATNLEALDAVLNLGPMQVVTTLSRQVTGEVSVADLALGRGTAYLLDAKGGRVIAVPLAAAGPPAIVFQEGDTYGGTPAKKPLFITWEGATGGRLLVLDAERKLFELRPGSLPLPLSLRRTNSWSSVAGLATYDGNLYVLDPAGDQVHRYLPAASGFDSEPADALSGQTDLADALGLAVDEDIFVYFKDGSVKRFRGGASLDFPLAGIDRLPKVASGLVVVSGAQEVYVADSGNKRIIVASREGVFRRQLVSNAITDLRVFGIDAGGGQLYVVVGDALLTAPIIR